MAIGTYFVRRTDGGFRSRPRPFPVNAAFTEFRSSGSPPIQIGHNQMPTRALPTAQ